MTVKASLLFGAPLDRAWRGPPGPATDPLAELARAGAGGDEAALHRLLRRLAPDVLRVARVVLGPDHSDLEYVLEECLLDVVRSIDEFRHETSVSRFALTIAFRRALLTRRSHPAPRQAPSRQGATRWRGNPDVERRRALVGNLLATLPEAQAEAIGLRLVVGLSIQEIAGATDVTAKTARSLLWLGKEALIAALEGEPPARDFTGPVQ